MAENKKQHFVPKMILRNFACDKDQKQINLIHLRSKKVIHSASLRDQCQKDYLYGQDGVLEHSLANMEGVFDQIIKRLIETQKIGRDFNTRYQIVELLALQKARTLLAEEEINRMTDQFAKLMMYNKFDREVLEKVRVQLSSAASFNVVQALKMCPIMFDLKHFFIINQTATPFIISDNPVLHTNWFCHTRLKGRSAGGIARSGLQVFMPIAPKYALYLHDKYVYEADVSDQVIRLKDDREVSLINKIQWSSAYKNVYFSQGFDEAHIEKCLAWDRGERKQSDILRLNPTGNVGEYIATTKTIFDPPDEGVTKELVHFSMPESKEDVRLRAVRVRSKPIYFDDGSAVSPARDLVWSDIIKDFVDCVEYNCFPFEKLMEFASSHPLFGGVGPEIRRIERALRITD